MKLIMGSIILLIICMLATVIDSNVSQAKQQQLFNLKSYDQSAAGGFIENKGQIRYSDGSSADDILYMFSSNGLKIYIKKNSISYEFYSIDDMDSGFRRNDIDRTIIDRNDFKKAAMLNRTVIDRPDEESLLPYTINSHRVDIEFVSANSKPKLIAEDCSDEYYNFYTSKGAGITNVRKFGKITIKDLYPGIDAVYYIANAPSSQNKFKYDLIVNPGADVSKIKMLYKGADDIGLSKDGNIIVKTSQGTMKESIPLAYYLTEDGSQKTEDGRKNIQEKVDCNFVISNLADNSKTDNRQPTTDNRQLTTDITQNNVYEVSFNVSNINNNQTLVIDPELFWGTYFGGEVYDYFTSVAVDSRDNIYVTGYTESTTLIATTGAFQTSFSAGQDAVLAKFNNQGRLEWATYYGGSGQDFGLSVVVNYEDKPLFAGYTGSTSVMSSAGSFQETYGGGITDGFVAKFTSAGQREWGTYYGGEEYDAIYSMALDSNRNMVIGGRTQSLTGIATGNGLQTYKEGLIDGFVIKFDSVMNRTWGTYIGGNDETGSETVTGVACDRSGNVIITGYTPCDYSITNDKGFQPSYGGGSYDAYIIKLYPSGSMHWGSYYGGTEDDFGRGVATYGNGNIYLIGTTRSYNNIASSGAHQETFVGYRDAFIVKFDTYGDRKWGTYYGGSDDDQIVSVSKYGFDEVIAYGYTLSSSGIATTGEVQTTKSGEEDAFAVRFNTSGVRKWGTYYGGNRSELFQYGCISYDKKGNVIICGTTNSDAGIATPETNPHEGYYVGKIDTFQTTDGGLSFTYKNDAFLVMIGTRITINNFAAEYCQGKTMSVPFTVGLDFESNNVFTLELSDKDGGFSNPTDIGTLNSNTSGWIQGTIPLDMEAGTGYRVRIRASSPSNTSDNNGFDITIHPLPEPEIMGETSICSRNIYIYQTQSGAGYEHIWQITNGTIIGDSTSGVIYIKWNDAPQGNIKLIQTATATGCIDSTEQIIEIIIAPEPFITGEESVTAYSEEEYSTFSNSKIEYEWLVTGGTILGLTNTNRIQVGWSGPGVGSILLKLTDTKTACSDTAMINVTINSSALKILGKKKVCAFSNEKYSVITPNTNINLWSVTAGQIIGSNQDSIINVLWSSAAEGFLQLIQTDTSTSQMDTVVLRVEIIPAPVVEFYGIDEFCEGATAIYSAVTTQNRTSKWTIYKGQIIGDDNKDSVTVIWNDLDPQEDSLFIKGSITLTQTDLETGCSNSKIKTTAISKNPLVEFLGNLQVCSGRVETYFVKDKNTLSNKWTVTGGTIIGIAEDTTLIVEWGQSGKGKIKLFQVAASTCYDSSETEITINPVPEKPTIIPSGKDLLSSSETGNQWYYNSEKLVGEVNKIITPGKTGYYSLSVTNQEGCESDLSQPYYFEISSVNDISDLGIKVFPNPAANILNIDFNSFNLLNTKLKIFNTLGVTFYLSESIPGKNIKIDLQDYPQGMYILEIQTTGKSYFEKFIKE